MASDHTAQTYLRIRTPLRASAWSPPLSPQEPST